MLLDTVENTIEVVPRIVILAAALNPFLRLDNLSLVLLALDSEFTIEKAGIYTIAYPILNTPAKMMYHQ